MNKVKLELQKRGMSANRLGLEAKISPANLSQALNGKCPMFPAWRKRIAEVLGISEVELFPEYSGKEA